MVYIPPGGKAELIEFDISKSVLASESLLNSLSKPVQVPRVKRIGQYTFKLTAGKTTAMTPSLVIMESEYTRIDLGDKRSHPSLDYGDETEYSPATGSEETVVSQDLGVTAKAVTVLVYAKGTLSGQSISVYLYVSANGSTYDKVDTADLAGIGSGTRLVGLFYEGSFRYVQIRTYSSNNYRIRVKKLIGWT